MSRVTERAKEIATNAHKHQKCRDGRPYIKHPEAVAELCVTLGKIFCPQYAYELIATGWLHDVVEDTDYTLDQLGSSFSEVIIDAVESVTRRDNESYLQYILRAKDNEIGRLVKLADLRHNLHDLEERHLRDKYEMALFILDN